MRCTTAVHCGVWCPSQGYLALASIRYAEWGLYFMTLDPPCPRSCDSSVCYYPLAFHSQIISKFGDNPVSNCSIIATRIVAAHNHAGVWKRYPCTVKYALPLLFTSRLRFCFRWLLTLQRSPVVDSFNLWGTSMTVADRQGFTGHQWWSLTLPQLTTTLVRKRHCDFARGSRSEISTACRAWRLGIVFPFCTASAFLSC